MGYLSDQVYFATYLAQNRLWAARAVAESTAVMR